MESITFKEHIGITTGDETQIDYIIKLLYKSRDRDPNQQIRTVRNGWQIRDFLKESPTIHNIVPLFYSNLSEYLKLYEPTDGIQFNINNIWANILPPGGFNTLHDHPGCQIAAVWWLKAEENSGDILLQNPFPSKRLRDYRAMRNVHILERIKPERNKMIFFDSSLMHMVDANNSNADRISISMNFDLSNKQTGTRGGLPIVPVV